MDVQKLKNNLEQRKAKRDRIKNQLPFSDSALNVLAEAELDGVKSEIQYLKQKISRRED